MISRLIVPLSIISLSVSSALASNIPLNTPRIDSLDNFRDVAGTQNAYSTTNNGVMRGGIFYRSSALSPSLADTPMYNSVGIKYIFDLRSASEATAVPDLIPPGAQYQHIDIIGHAVTSVSPTSEADAIAWMQQLNVSFVNDATIRNNFATLFNELAAADGAAVFHCREGKDRTGWTAAMLQSIAGVSIQDIMDNYLATNQYSQNKIDATLAAMSPADAAIYRHIFSVDASYLQAGLDEINSQYGSVDNYLKQGLGLSQETIYVLRAKMVRYLTLPGQGAMRGNNLAGANLLNQLQNSPLSGRYTNFNYFLQSSVTRGSLMGVETRIGGQVYADTASYLLRQATEMDYIIEPLINDESLKEGEHKVWGRILQGYNSIDSTNHSAASNDHTTGAVFGVSQRINNNLTGYGHFGYSRGQVSTARATVDTNRYHVGAGGRNLFNNDMFVHLGVNGSIIDYRGEREIGENLGTAKGKTNGYQLGAKAEFGYQLKHNLLVLEPSLGLKVSHLHLSGFNEKGSEVALKVKRFNETNTSAIANLNMKFNAMNAGTWSVSPVVAVGYERYLSSPTMTSEGEIYANKIEQKSAFTSRNQLRGSAGVSVGSGPLTLAATGDIIHGKNNTGYSGNVVFSYAF